MDIQLSLSVERVLSPLNCVFTHVKTQLTIM